MIINDGGPGIGPQKGKVLKPKPRAKSEPKAQRVLHPRASSQQPPPKVTQRGGPRDTRGDNLGVRNLHQAVRMPEILSGVNEAANRLYLQSQPKPGDKEQQKRAKAARKALQNLFKT